MYYIYKFLNESNEIIYIGITNDLLKRMKYQHFSGYGHLPSECYENTKNIEIHECLSKEDANIRERYLVNTLSPKYNITYNNKNRFSFRLNEWNWYKLPSKIYSLSNKVNYKECDKNDKQLNDNWDAICTALKHGYKLKQIYEVLIDSKEISTSYKKFKFSVGFKKDTLKLFSGLNKYRKHKGNIETICK